MISNPASVIFTLLFSQSLGAEPPAPSLATLRNTYVQAVTSIHTLDCRFKAVRDDADEQIHERGERAIVAFEYQLLRRGNMRAVLTSRLAGGGEVKSRHWVGFDGKLYATWTERAGKLEKPQDLPFGRVESEINNFLYPSEAIDRLLGNDLCTGCISVADLLQRDGVVVGPWERMRNRSQGGDESWGFLGLRKRRHLGDVVATDQL